MMTRSTNLIPWGQSEAAVLQSGVMVFWGKTTESLPPELHFYKGSSSEPAVKIATQPAFCQHLGVNLLPLPTKVGRGKRDFGDSKAEARLAVSCINCEQIRSFNLTTKEIDVVFHQNYKYPGQMCLGEDGKIFVKQSQQGLQPILELEPLSKGYFISKMVESGLSDSAFCLCFVPKLLYIVLGYNRQGLIRAVARKTDTVMWELKGDVEGSQINPHGLVYLPSNEALLVADGKNTRILVLDAADGVLKQVIPLEKSLGAMWDLFLHKDQLLVFHATNRLSVSFFKLDMILQQPDRRHPGLDLL